MNVSDIIEQWQVSINTAKRDVLGLKNKGLIEFVGGALKIFFTPPPRQHADSGVWCSQSATDGKFGVKRCGTHL